MTELSHLDRDGRAQMVNVAHKPVSDRAATASAEVFLGADAFCKVMAGETKKGNVFAVARVAGILAAKKTSDLIPLCHPLALSHIGIDFEPDSNRSSIRILATARVSAQTGVEMEAMTAAAIAALTIYDMCKAIDRSIRIGDLRLVEKSGGQSGGLVAEQ